MSSWTWPGRGARRVARLGVTRRRADALMVGGGLAVLAVGMAVVGESGHLPAWERRLTLDINGLPDGLSPVMWPLGQLGVLAAGPAVAVVAACTRRWRLALAALVVTVAKLVTEPLVKDVVSRQRPAVSIGSQIHVRGASVEVTGESFVSGHAVLVAALAGIITPYLPGRWKALPWTLVVIVLVVRVYVGAHNVLDVVSGAGLGAAIAGVLNLVLGVPSPWRKRGAR